MTYLLATNNPAKVQEIRSIFSKHGLAFMSLSELGLYYEPSETGETFEENAIQKATKTLAFLRENGHESITVIADDSGLCINAMGGLPGVDSANFMGRDTPYDIRNAHIISKLIGSTDRGARFVCVIACAYPNGKVITAEGEIHGQIAHSPAGVDGFGYDPIFYLPEYGQTSAQLPMHEKNRISHRGRALEAMIKIIQNHTC